MMVLLVLMLAFMSNRDGCASFMHHSTNLHRCAMPLCLYEYRHASVFADPLFSGRSAAIKIENQPPNHVSFCSSFKV